MRKKVLHLTTGVSASALLLTALFLLLGDMHTQAAAVTDTAAVRQAAGVALSPGYSQEGEPGIIVAYTHILTNTGTNTDTFDLEATNSRGWLVTLAGGNWPTGTALLPLTVSGDATATFIVSVTIPATANITASTFITATSQISGSVRATATDTTTVGMQYIHLPLVVQDHRPFANGDFEDGLRGWSTRQGPFPLNGRGSGMPQSVVSFEGSHRALLGEPSASNRYIPVGYGCISQTFTVDKRYLQLPYRVISYDVVTGTQGYYDTFEVSVNRPPAQVSDTERDTRCTRAALNPEETLVVSDAGLVFCGGRSGASSVAGTQWDSGWMTVTLDLNTLQLQGRNITLYISIWSREYSSPYYKDHAWYNTWAYVDNLDLQE